MKNGTLFFVWLFNFFCFHIEAKVSQVSNIGLRIGPASIVRPNTSNNSSSIIPFYIEEFNGGLPADWQIIDNAGNGVNWKWTTTGIYHTGFYTGLEQLNSNGTSASNGYLLYDSDSAGQSVGGENADLISGAINCSMRSNVHLKFNQLLYHFYESAKVYVSNDGTSWTEVYEAGALLGVNQTTPNPHVADIDISAMAAKHPTVYIKFNFTGDYDYWWMIDDVSLYEEPVITDGSILSVNSPGSSCTGLTNAETISIEIGNTGTAVLQNFNLSYSIDGGNAITENISDTIAPAASYTYDFITPADLESPGSHAITVYLNIPGDTITTNDTLTINIYNGVHPVNATSDYQTSFEQNEDQTVWNTEDLNHDHISWNISDTLAASGNMCASYQSPNIGVFANDWLWTTCLDLTDNTAYQLDFDYRTYSNTTDAYIEVAVSTSQAAQNIVSTIIPPTPVSSFAYQNSSTQFSLPINGVYYIGFHVLSGIETTALRLDDIRISTGQNVGFDRTEKQPLRLFPNPTDGLLHIEGGNSNNYLVEITNILGEKIHSEEFDLLQNESIDLSMAPAGVYTIRIVSELSSTSYRIVVN